MCLASAEFIASDTMAFTDASNFYRCVEPVESGEPDPLDGACGAKDQRCCSTGEQSSQCGVGMTCNLGMSSFHRLQRSSSQHLMWALVQIPPSVRNVEVLVSYVAQVHQYSRAKNIQFASPGWDAAMSL